MKSKRTKIHFSMVNSGEYPQLIFNEENFLLVSSDTRSDIILFDEINLIKICIVNRIYNPSIGILNDGIKGFLTHRNAGQFSIYFNYYIDLDIYTDKFNYYFESSDLEKASKFILELDKNFSNIEDDLNLIDLFKTKSYSKAKENIDKNYKIWAKTYKLDNPRTTLDTLMTDLVDHKLNK